MLWLKKKQQKNEQKNKKKKTMCFMDSKSQTSISSELSNKMIDEKRAKPKEKRRYVSLWAWM